MHWAGLCKMDSDLPSIPQRTVVGQDLSQASLSLSPEAMFYELKLLKGRNWPCCDHEATRKNIVAASGSCREVHPTPLMANLGEGGPESQKNLTRVKLKTHN